VNEEEQDTLRRWWRAPEYWLLVQRCLYPCSGWWWIVVPLTLAGLSVELAEIHRVVAARGKGRRAGGVVENRGLSTFIASRQRSQPSCFAAMERRTCMNRRGRRARRIIVLGLAQATSAGALHHKGTVWGGDGR